MSKPLVLGSIAAVVGLFALGGLFLWQQSLQQAGPEVGLGPSSPTPAPTPSPQPQTEEIDTSNWQTYRNEEYGFEVKYPEDLFVSSEFGLISLSNDEAFGQSEFALVVTIGIANRGDLVVTEVSSSDVQGMDISSLQETVNRDIYAMFSGDPPWSYRNVFIPFSQEQTEGILFTIRTHNIDYPAYGGSFEDRDLAAQILSTFRFVKEETAFDSLDDRLDSLPLWCGSEAEVSVEEANFDSDGEKEYFIQCSLHLGSPFGGGRLYILDDEQTRWEKLWTMHIQGNVNIYLEFVSPPVLIDVDTDGIQEVNWTGDVRGGTCVGGTDYKLLYSHKYRELFYTSQERYYEFNEQGDCTNLLAEPLEFSENLENEGYKVFKEYLINQE